ncbi:MAG: tetratricopeptide repeat protein [Alphaproteobacteria bacterium]
MRKVRLMIAAGALGAAVLAWPAADAGAAATGTTKPSAPAPEEAYEAGQELVESGDFAGARDAFEQAARLDPTDADAFNMLAYSQRRLGQLDDAFDNYGKALALDPEHKGAHEYIGEAYLMVGDLEKAEAHLATLMALCPDGCEESRMLGESVERYKQNDQNATLDSPRW